MSDSYQELDDDTKNKKCDNFLEIIRTVSVVTIAIILLIFIIFLISNFGMIKNLINNGSEAFSEVNNIVSKYDPNIELTLRNINYIGDNFNLTLDNINFNLIRDIELLVKNAEINLAVLQNKSSYVINYLQSIEDELKKIIG